MTKGLIFRWEDSPALKHHCGFCARPLNHPGALTSCFGIHHEPCHRFHQAMFMRLRAHTCAYCHTIDEAHWKRHREIAEVLLSIYKSCGEVEWSVILSDPEERERHQELDAGLADMVEEDYGLMLREAPPSKRERKDIKKLARASNRSRVVTQDEIQHIDSILHLGDGFWARDSDSPHNQEEVDEIEQHLRYNAHVYNKESSHQELRKFMQLPGADVDFAVEIERILETIRISELVKRNSRNMGLQGKELKKFHILVEGFKKIVIEDLVLVKKDMLEIRMRRAGYLRYTNKTAYSIVEERYMENNWKTGGKLTSSTSNSSSSKSSTDDTNVLESKPQEITTSLLPPSAHHPDYRHLKSIHMRVNGHDGLYRVPIEPYHTPLLSHPSDPVPRKKLISLKVVTERAAEDEPISIDASDMEAIQQENSVGWEVVSYGKGPKPMKVKSGRANHFAARLSKAHLPRVTRMSPAKLRLPNRICSSALTTKTTNDTAIAGEEPRAVISIPNKPEQNVMFPVKQTDDRMIWNSAVPKKKAKKASREANHKVKKFTAPNGVVNASAILTDIPRSALNDTSNDQPIPLASPTAVIEDVQAMRQLDSLTRLTPISDEVEPTVLLDKAVHPHLSQSEEPGTLALSTPFAPSAIIKQSKHMDWLKFTQNFVVDQLTIPRSLPQVGCFSNSLGTFNDNEACDGPIDGPCCSCFDPMRYTCYIIFPGCDYCSSGPYNAFHGGKVLEACEKDSQTRGRFMLIDSALFCYLQGDPATLFMRGIKSKTMPVVLKEELIQYSCGKDSGIFMKKEETYRRLWYHNRAINTRSAWKMLKQVLHKKSQNADTVYMCYCRDLVLEDCVDPTSVVMCSHRDCNLVYFHKSCIKGFGVDAGSQWFCTPCGRKMQELAHQTLRILGFTDIPEKDVSKGFFTEQSLNERQAEHFERASRIIEGDAY
ncbi:hypothetical protein BKA66DRAFT_290268 [Pyrenochaeta sp. MPI-SDFR-AT-0127]|nr:hypothetical protein BKA66DRAFT_290268 [Pyrenochaeta sp. MPI-SDFR-AT-0127]